MWLSLKAIRDYSTRYDYKPKINSLQPWKIWFSSVQLLSCVRLFATPWTTACRASLSITNSWSPPKPMSIELVMPSNHLILCHPLLSCPQSFPASESFPVSQLFELHGQSIGVSASKSVLPMNTQDWSPYKRQVLWFPLMCRSETKMEISWIWPTLLTANRTDYIKCAVSVVNSHNCSIRWRNSWEAKW